MDSGRMDSGRDWKLAAVKLPVNDIEYENSPRTPGSDRSASSPSFASGLEKLAITAQQAKLKQLKRVQLVKSQTYQSASMMAHRHEKDSLEEIRYTTVQARQSQLAAERMAREASAEARRKEIAAEEKRKTEALKESLTEKLGSAEQKAALLLQQRARDTEMARVHRAVEAKARQEAMLWNTLKLNEERHARQQQKELAAEQAEQRVAAQRAQAEEEIRQKALQAETERLQTIEAAEKEFDTRYRYFQAKADAKQEVIQAKKAEQAALRAARTADARQREEAARLRLEQKLKKDEEERQECARRVQEKQDRTKAFEEQRQALMRELETTRNEIAVHEAYLKAVSGKMKEDGKYEIPPALEALEQKYCAELGDFQMNSSTQHWNPSDSSPKIGNKAN